MSARPSTPRAAAAMTASSSRTAQAGQQAQPLGFNSLAESGELFDVLSLLRMIERSLDPNAEHDAQATEDAHRLALIAGQKLQAVADKVFNLPEQLAPWVGLATDAAGDLAEGGAA